MTTSDVRYCSILCGSVPSQCPRRPCETCVDDLAERAALIADGERCSQAAATVLARVQALTALPGQRSLVAGQLGRE